MKIIIVVILICLTLSLTMLLRREKSISQESSNVDAEKTVFLEDDDTTMIWYGDADDESIKSLNVFDLYESDKK